MKKCICIKSIEAFKKFSYYEFYEFIAKTGPIGIRDTRLIHVKVNEHDHGDILPAFSPAFSSPATTMTIPPTTFNPYAYDFTVEAFNEYFKELDADNQG